MIILGSSKIRVAAGGGGSGYRTALTALSPTAYWYLDETSGTSIVDAIGGHNGTTAGSPTLNQTSLCNSGQSITFDGVDDGISVTHNSALNPGIGEYAVVMMLAFSGTGQQLPWGKFLFTPAYDGATVFLNTANNSNTAGKIELRESGSSSSYWLDTATGSLNDGTPRHYVFQRRKTSTGPDVWKLQIYINGTLDAEKTSTNTNLADTNPLYIGRTNVQFLNGKLDEVAYFVGKSLTSSEISTLYAAI